MDTNSLRLQNTLNQHTSELQTLLNDFNKNGNARQGCNVTTKPWLPGFFIKYGVERVANAQKLRQVIEKLNLDLLSVPEKFLYHVPSRPEKLLSENYLVIAKEVCGNKGRGQRLNLQQVQQLYQLALAAKHYDLHPANVVTKKGRVTIIDTDNLAMPCKEEVMRRELDWLLHGNRLHNNGGICMNPDIINDPLIKLELPMYSKWDNYDEQAYEFLSKKREEREKQRLGLTRYYKILYYKLALTFYSVKRFCDTWGKWTLKK